MLDPRQGGVYVDATVGLGGHAAEILKLIGAGGRLIGIDRDNEALKIAKERLADERVILQKGRFSMLRDLLNEAGIKEVDGVLFDFGVSMMQFKDLGRGFSFISDDPLDMRMDRSQRLRAEDIVNTYPEDELERIFREYGEERLAAKIAKAIVNIRKKKRIRTCAEMADIVAGVYRRRGRHHPATRTFQALRIAVNDEINEINKGLEASVSILRHGGRLCTISYHSLEDRAVKNFLRNSEREGLVRIITKKPLSPTYDEVKSNPSSRSAKLRGAERL
ncbi:MAG: 16S rRNA (cytosine(1402)-N(4))-methyltransferase RsmH [Thermodesulfovibrionales bacterium]